MDHSLDVLVLEMGVVKRVYVDRLGVRDYSVLTLGFDC
jgi:hypothetical protein